MVANSASFTTKFGLVFVLKLENAFHFKTNRKSIGSSKTVLGIFKITLCLK